MTERWGLRKSQTTSPCSPGFSRLPDSLAPSCSRHWLRHGGSTIGQYSWLKEVKPPELLPFVASRKKPTNISQITKSLGEMLSTSSVNFHPKGGVSPMIRFDVPFPILSSLLKLLNILICWLAFLKLASISSYMTICQTLLAQAVYQQWLIVSVGLMCFSSSFLGCTHPALANWIGLRYMSFTSMFKYSSPCFFYVFLTVCCFNMNKS